MIFSHKRHEKSQEGFGSVKNKYVFSRKNRGLVLFALLAGCSTYQPAVVLDGVIQNPTIGWDGYSIRIPEGTVLVCPSIDSNASARAKEFSDWYKKQTNRYGWEWYSTTSEQFVLEDTEQTYFISFIADTFELPTTWSHITTFQMRYASQKMINRKMVVINDMEAHNEQIMINGHRAWYISGESRPYFKKQEAVLAYEGIFIFGALKEAFWIEGFGDLGIFRREQRLK